MNNINRNFVTKAQRLNMTKKRHIFRRNKSEKTVKQLGEELKDITGAENYRYIRLPNNKSIYTEQYKNVLYIVKDVKVDNLGRKYKEKTVFFTDK